MIIAVDFDGILCENKFPYMGKPNYEVISLVRQLIDVGHEVVLWTSRVDQELDNAVKWCEDRGLHFCAINENAPSNINEYSAKYPNGTRKVYADVYIDDHNIEYVCHKRKMGGTPMDHCIALIKSILNTTNNTPDNVTEDNKE